MLASVASSSSSVPVLVPSKSPNPYREVGLISDLVKDQNPPTPEVLGLGNFEDYRYIEYIEDLLAKGKVTIGSIKIQELIDEAKENIRIIQADIRKNGAKYYFFKAGIGLNASSNPYIARLKGNQFVWGSIVPSFGIDAFKIAESLAKKNQSVYVNTGTHGDEYGNMACDIVEAGDASHIDQFYFHFETRYSGKVACGVVNYEYTTPLEPKEANHVINRWCTSIRNRFTSSYHLNAPADLSGNFLHPEFRCVRELKPIKVPYFFHACHRSSLGGTVHFYDIEGIAKWIYQGLKIHLPPHTPNDLQRMTPQDIVSDCIDRFPEKKSHLGKLKGVKCCVIECNAHFDLTDAKFSDTVSKAIEAFNRHKQEIEAEKTARQAEIQLLQGEGAQKDVEITTLKGRVTELEERDVQKDQQIAQKDRQITVVTAERVEALEKVKEQGTKIEQQALRIDVLIRNQTTGEFILNSAFVRGIGQHALEPRLQHQISLTEKTLEEIFLGNSPVGWLLSTHRRIRFRANGFIVNPGTPDIPKIKEHIKVVFEELGDLVKLQTENLLEIGFPWKTVSITEKQTEEFLYPLMNRLIKEDRVANRLVAKLEQHGVSIKIGKLRTPIYWTPITGNESLDYEPGRVAPMSYQNTITEIVSQCLRYEIADSMLTAFKA